LLMAHFSFLLGLLSIVYARFSATAWNVSFKLPANGRRMNSKQLSDSLLRLSCATQDFELIPLSWTEMMVVFRHRHSKDYASQLNRRPGS
jgi:hypothetical protein